MMDLCLWSRAPSMLNGTDSNAASIWNRQPCPHSLGLLSPKLNRYLPIQIGVRLAAGEMIP